MDNFVGGKIVISITRLINSRMYLNYDRENNDETIHFPGF